MSVVNHPQKYNDKQEVRNAYNTISQNLLNSFGKRALKDATNLVQSETNNLTEEHIDEIAFSIYRAYILGAVLEKSNKDSIQFNEDNEVKNELQREIKKTNNPNVLQLVVR